MSVQREKINTFEVELKKNTEEQEKKGFFEKLAHRSKEVYLKSNQSIGLKNLIRHYQKAGENLANIDGEKGLPPELAGMTEQEPLKVAFVPLEKNRERQQILLNEDNALASKETELLQKLENLNIPVKNLSRAYLELESRQKTLAETILRTYRDIGNLWCGLDKKIKKTLELPVTLNKKWEELQKEEIRLERERDILNQKILIKNLEQKSAYHEDEINRLNLRIEKTIEQLNAEKSELEKVKAERAALNKALLEMEDGK